MTEMLEFIEKNFIHCKKILQQTIMNMLDTNEKKNRKTQKRNRKC